MIRNRIDGFKSLSPDRFKALKTAILLTIQDHPDFNEHEVNFFMSVVDRIGRHDVSAFMYLVKKFSDISVTDETVNEAKSIIKEKKEERKSLRRGR